MAGFFFIVGCGILGSMDTPLLPTKLYIPPPRPELVPRPRLIERLNEGLYHKLTLISAPAGSGKTTLVSDWLRQIERPTAWLSLDQTDNDLSQFWAYLVAALQTTQPALGQMASAALQALDFGNTDAILLIENIVSNLINEISTRSDPLLLILDDYHLIATTEIHHSLNFLLNYLPPSLHLILISREDPPLPLTQLRARGHITEIRERDLRFTAEESGYFLNQTMQLNLSPESITTLGQRTEGWIVGLQLAALSMQGVADPREFIADFAGDDRYIVDYLVSEILAYQAPHTQDFLLKSSILESLTANLGAAVTGQEESQEILSYLEQANLFLIPLDNKRLWFRYHHLFRDLLRVRLREQMSKQEVAVLHYQAAIWFQDTHNIDNALHHFLAAEAVKEAVQLVEVNAFAAIQRGHINDAQRWIQALPTAAVQASLRLCLDQAWINVELEHHQNLAVTIEDARIASEDSTASKSPALEAELAALESLLTAYEAYNKGKNQTALALSQKMLAQFSPDAQFIRSWFALLSIYTSYNIGNMTEALEYSQQAFELCQATGNQTGSLWAIGLAGRAYLLQVDRPRIERTYQRAFTYATDLNWAYIPYMGTIYQDYGRFLYELNRLTEAEDHLRHGINLNRQLNLFNEEMEGRLYLRQLLWATGITTDPLTSDEAFDTLWATLYQQDLMPEDELLFRAYQAQQWLREGHLALVSQWIHQTQPSLIGNLDYPLDVGPLTLARFYLAEDRDLVAVQLFLAEYYRTAMQRGHTLRAIEIAVLQALVYTKLKKDQDAQTVLEQALTLAEPAGLVRVFVDEGPSMFALLTEVVQKKSRLQGYIQQLLSAFEAKPEDQSAVSGPQPLVEPLSPRELEVLQLIAVGHSNSEIAQELTVAVSTVKTHINRIFAKLDARDRIQAVNRARELALLPQ